MASGDQPFRHRVASACAAMQAAGMDAFLVTSPINIRWLTGFTGSAGLMVLTDENAVLATDSRYVEQAGMECPWLPVEQIPSYSASEIVRIVERAGASRIGFEAGYVTVQQHRTWVDALGSDRELLPAGSLLDDLRLIKDEAEIAAIEEACRIADQVYEALLPQIRPGVTERDLMLELEWKIRKDFGADVAFDTILLSGPRTALPHGKPSQRPLEAGDFVTMDFGARVQGYCSDITRTVVVGRPSTEQVRVYTAVLRAQQRALELMAAGVAGKAVDQAARSVIAEAGHAEHFGHGLGHSLGLSVHDGPGLSQRSELVLATGMVMTVEPGIYVPGWGGVRIEEDVLVTSDGCRRLTRSATELTVV
ncbi:MAG: M24 family metallopeptidase [Chthonomonadales bacterium]